MERNPRYGIAGIGVAGLMVAGYYPARLLCQIGRYILPAVAGIGKAGAMVAGLTEGASNFREMRRDSLQIEDNGLDVPRASFAIVSDVEHKPLEGQQVTIAVGTLLNPVFTGYLDDVQESARDTANNVYACSAIGLTKDLRKRQVSETFTAAYADDIVRELVTRYAPHFHAQTYVERGVWLDSISFDGETALKACTTLAERSNFVFYVDHFREVHFKRREANQAPWSIVSGERFDGLEFGDKSSELKNRVIVRYSELQSRTDIFLGDGELEVFPLSRVPYELQSLTVNGLPVSFGSRYQANNADNDFSVYLTEAELHVQAADIPALGDVIELHYTAKIPAKLTVNHAASQADRRKKEGGDGIYEHTIKDREILSAADAKARADAVLEQDAWPHTTATYTRTEYLLDLFSNRLQVGQQQPIDIWGRSLALNIERVTTSVVRPAHDHTLKFSQQVELGPVSQGLEAVFEDLTASSGDDTVDEIENTLYI